MAVSGIPNLALAREYQVMTEYDGMAAVSPALVRRLWQAVDIVAARRINDNAPPEEPYQLLVGEDVVSLWLMDQKLAVVARGSWRQPTL